MLVGKNYPLKFKGLAVQSTAKCTYPLRFVSSDLKFSVPVSSLISLKQACLHVFVSLLCYFMAEYGLRCAILALFQPYIMAFFVVANAQ